MTQDFLTKLLARLNGAAPFLNGSPLTALYWGYAPKDKVLPFAVMFNVGPPLSDWNVEGNVEDTRIQISLYGNVAADLYTYHAQIRARLNLQTLALSGNNSLGILCLAEPYSVLVPPDEKDSSGRYVHHVAADYRFSIQN